MPRSRRRRIPVRVPRLPGLPDPLAGCRGSLTYRLHNGGWICTSDWPYLIEEGTLVVPRGFRCDLASIPRPLRIIPGFCREELGLSAPILHDAVYRGVVGRGPDITLDRKRTDRLFRTLMRCDGVGPVRAAIAWAAVRMLGLFAWRILPSRAWALQLAD